jgi:hypothetical protein
VVGFVGVEGLTLAFGDFALAGDFDKICQIREARNGER